MLSQVKWARTGLAALMVVALLTGLAWAVPPEGKGKPDKPGDEDPPPPPPPVTYEITWLGTLGGLESKSTDMNDLGDAVGWSYATNGDLHAFPGEVQLDGSRSMVNLNTYLCSTFASDLTEITTPRFAGGNAINNVGQVVGVMRFNNDADRVLYRYTPTPVPTRDMFLEVSNRCQTMDINIGGTFVGNEHGVDGDNYAYRYA